MKTIVIAWLTSRVSGLPRMKTPTVEAVVYISNPTDEDMFKASKAAMEIECTGGNSCVRVFLYEDENKPLERAKTELLAIAKARGEAV